MFKALKSFAGIITMNKGQVKEIKDKNLIKSLLDAGYIEPVEEKKTTKAIKKVK